VNRSRRAAQFTDYEEPFITFSAPFLSRSVVFTSPPKMHRGGGFMDAVLAEERFSSGAECDDADRERRAELRSFLTKIRSDLRPQDVGLPSSSHRRVPGLRRQEVAELVGVSEDWYRWFESGRPISVSPRFIAGLAKALRLNPFDEVGLYRLALPELYRADRVAGILYYTACQLLVSAVPNRDTPLEKARENRPERKASDVR
jgi:transcriptional regulator with XRE-family HTH domain